MTRAGWAIALKHAAVVLILLAAFIAWTAVPS